MTCLVLGSFASCGAAEQVKPDSAPVDDRGELRETRPGAKPSIDDARPSEQSLVRAVVAPGISATQQRVTKAFLDFAAAPSAGSASRVPFV